MVKKFKLRFEERKKNFEVESKYGHVEPKWYVILPYEKGTPCTKVGTDHIWIGSITSDFLFVPEFIEGRTQFFSIQELQEIINFCKKQIKKVK